LNSEEFRETFLRNDREGPTRAKTAEKMTENNVWGKEVAKMGTEGPQDQRSEAGKVKAESSLETTGSLAPVYREEGIQDWEGLSKSERDLDFVNETMRTDQIQNVIVMIEMYKAVRSVLSAGQDPLKLNPRMKLNRGEDPGFMVPGDERILRNANMCSLEEKRICSTSFDPVSGRCFTCLNGDHRAWAARDGGPICVVLTDQHFPANIPADSAGECMRILRIENGSLSEMADELLKLAPLKDGIPKGSVILYGSTAYMGIISAERYAAEWVRNRNWLLERLGEVIILPGIR
jgi:hypothetical protein